MKQIKILDAIINKFLSEVSDNRLKTGLKAVKSLKCDKKVEKISRVVRDYTQAIANHATVSSAYQPTTSMAQSHACRKECKDN